MPQRPLLALALAMGVAAAPSHGAPAATVLPAVSTPGHAREAAPAPRARASARPVVGSAVRRWGLRALALGIGAGFGWALMRLGGPPTRHPREPGGDDAC